MPRLPKPIGPYAPTRTNFNRCAAAKEQLDAITNKYKLGATGLDAVLDAQRRLADAGSGYFRSVSTSIGRWPTSTTPAARCWITTASS